jgi:hypothetical protein
MSWAMCSARRRPTLVPAAYLAAAVFESRVRSRCQPAAMGNVVSAESTLAALAGAAGDREQVKGGNMAGDDRGPVHLSAVQGVQVGDCHTFRGIPMASRCERLCRIFLLSWS